MRRLHIFRAGTHSPLAGGTLEFGAADLEATARAYDPARHEAPIVVGHPALDAPAYGWVGGLSAEGEGLFAAPRQVEPQFAAMVEGGRFKKISASFFGPTHPRNPTPGVYYLKHVGFLGAAPPAIAGLKPVQFAAGDEALTVEFAAEIGGWRLGWLFSDIAGVLRGFRDYVVGKEGAEAGERLVPGATIQRVAEEGARLQAEAAADVAPAPGFSAPPTLTKDTAVTEQEIAARERAAQQREEAIAAREAAFAAQQAETRRAEDAAFVDGLVAAAQLPAGLAPRAVAMFAALDAEGEVSFAAADGKPVKEAARDAFRTLLSGLPKTVSFGAAAGGPGPGAGDPPATAEFSGRALDPDRAELHRKALAWQRANPNTDYLTAVQAVETAG